jgi:hypothetical protein
MTITELRKQLKSIGYNVRTQSNDLGTFAHLCLNNGDDIPSIFGKKKDLLPHSESIDLFKAAKRSGLTTSKGDKIIVCGDFGYMSED